MSEQLRLIDILRTHVSRLELHFGARDILALDASFLEQYAQSLRGLTCSLHLPNFPDTTENIQPLINKIGEIVERLSIEYCVLHADEYVKLKLKMPDVVLGFQFGLENSDIRKFGFQHLRDLGMFNLPVI
ncbi:MAG: hypothetical protein KGJ34_02530, partial [Patescibacteria group bacterium]|nr:hypothetical protein [Patescibacteria group bacterium]